MSAALAITKRELREYFNSPIAYIVATVFMLVAGFMFWNTLFLENQAEMRNYFGLTTWMFPIIVPAITMRLIAEEKGSGTLELLITSPIRDWEVVVGKFLAALTLLAVIIGLTGVYAISIASVGPLDKGATLAGYLGLVLMGGTYVAVGVMASAFTKNQIVAFIIGFAICFALFLFGKVVQVVPEGIRPFLAYLSTDTHFESVTRGVIDTRDVVYYLSVIAVSLVIATVSLESRKWK